MMRVQPAGSAAPGASGDQTAELAAYVENRFDLSRLDGVTTLPPPDEPFVACWQRWAGEARERGAFEVLAEHLPQLRFPVREGMRRSDAYRAATLRGVPVSEIPEATGLPLPRPELVDLRIHPSPAGRIPVLVVRGREEFVLLVQALAKRNEPMPVPESQGASMVAGYNNWARIHEHRRRWEALPSEERQAATWEEELRRLRERPELYRDRFILLSDGPYSAVPASDLGLEDEEWRELSLALRRDHECAHYFTRRLFGSMRNHLHDELIADYAGLVAAAGGFRAGWFLRFLGLDRFPEVRPEGRVHVYRGDPPLSDGAFRRAQELVVRAAAQVEHFDAGLPAGERSLADRARALTSLTSLSLAELAGEDGAERLKAAFAGCEAALPGGR